MNKRQLDKERRSQEKYHADKLMGEIPKGVTYYQWKTGNYTKPYDNYGEPVKKKKTVDKRKSLPGSAMRSLEDALTEKRQQYIVYQKNENRRQQDIDQIDMRKQIPCPAHLIARLLMRIYPFLPSGLSVP